MDRFKIDSHKINYHVDRVAEWMMRSKTVYPIYVEITPSGACNHRCTFCAVDYIGYKMRFLEKDLLKNRISEMAQKGVRSIMFAGEGEPLLHKHLAEVIRHTSEAGIDASITTNAVALTEKFAREALPHTTWIKASVNAGTRDAYAEIHRTKPEDFDRVIANLKRAAEIKKEIGAPCALGAQMVLLPENASGAVTLAMLGKSIGLDYVVIKPYSQHNMSVTHEYEGMRYDDYLTMADELERLSDDRFEVVFRRHTMDKLNESNPYYTQCQATPHFWAYIMADGAVYGCSAYLEDERFNYGNINQNTFEEIWEGEKRKASADYVEHGLDITECRKNCRMDEVNRYLWDLKHPPQHVNFI
ncbi:MAG: radical SAM protein [Candidatus Omnitrophica bacterium]|nr:radical SAM protein [Candidatus Omnitrophota bacterium]